MRSFLADFFKRYGCEVTESEREVDVKIPNAEDAPVAARELARRFGRDHLALVFDPHDAKAGVDLVAPGGHILRTIEDFLETRGRRAYVVAPRTRKLEKALVTEVLAPANGKKKLKLLMDERTEEEAWDAHFTFRLRYRGRERKDALLDVLVPVRQGPPPPQPLPEGEAAPALILEPRAVPPPPEAAEWEAFPRKRLPEVHLKEAFAKAITLVDELASREAVELEARARARLEKDASRLELFYDTAVVEQQTNRTATDVARMKIEELEAERILQRRELVESARVDAEAEPLQLLVVERPRRRVAVRVERPRPKEKGKEVPSPAAGQLELAFDLSTGEVEAPPCPACKKTLAGVSVCDDGHVVHEGCAAECETCDKVVCAACGAVSCARGGEVTGPECATLCDGCGERVCPDHVSTCKVCSSKRCLAGTTGVACLHACAHCRGLACEVHRLQLAIDGAEALAYLCTECGTACPGCERPEPRSALGRCEVCGRSFCGACLPLKKGVTACPTCRGVA